MIDDDGIGKPRSVEVAIDFGRDNGRAALVGDIEGFEGNAGIEDLTVAPGLDRRQAPERGAVVVDNGAVGEEGDECGGIVAVRGSDVEPAISGNGVVIRVFMAVLLN